MQQNILRDESVTKIYLNYIDNGSRRRIAVKLRFMDKRECFFSALLPPNFVKPKKKIPAELHAYTPDGVYKSKVLLIDSNFSLQDVVFELTLPKAWDFVQLRKSTRKCCELPINIKFNDGTELNYKTYDLSLGGISFKTRDNLSSIYKKISGILTLELPKDVIFNFPNGKLLVETKYVREKELEELGGEILYIFKFINIAYDDEDILKNFLIKLD